MISIPDSVINYLLALGFDHATVRRLIFLRWLIATGRVSDN